MLPTLQMMDKYKKRHDISIVEVKFRSPPHGVQSISVMLRSQKKKEYVKIVVGKKTLLECLLLKSNENFACSGAILLIAEI